MERPRAHGHFRPPSGPPAEQGLRICMQAVRAFFFFPRRCGTDPPAAFKWDRGAAEVATRTLGALFGLCMRVSLWGRSARSLKVVVGW